MSKVFISYSSSDRPAVILLKEALEQLSYDVWFDQDAILPGGYYAKDIATALKDVDVFVLMTSANSIGDKANNITGSSEVAKEVVLAQSSPAVIIPVKLDDCWMETTTHDEFTYLLARTQWLDAGYCNSSSDFMDVAQRIDSALVSGNFKFNHDTTLDEIDKLLKAGLFSQARSRMNANTFPDIASDRVVLINAILALSEQPISSLSKIKVDNLVRDLVQIRNESIRPAALYLQGALSTFYYQMNAVYDPTGGLASLKREAAELGRLKAKYVMSIAHLLPTTNQYSLQWAK